MIILDWIGQILLFFVLWKAVYWGAGYVLGKRADRTLAVDLGVNVALAILLLIGFSATHSVWWLMGMTGVLLGIVTAMATGGRRVDD
ncbi:MAG: DUF4191 domain-containing protein [Alicyclobacillus sp.]|nr:DUF4191 domain-containing protein [Alicyclobacillus sp.]